MAIDNEPGTESTTNPPQQKPENGSERRSVARRTLSTSESVQVESDWLKTLDERIKRGELTEEQKNNIIARHVVANRRLTERADVRSKKDPLTGLPNKGAYQEAYDQLIQNGGPFGLLMIDIDHFKLVNDTHGHLAGDRILIQAGRDLETNLRQERPDEKDNDQVFRFGGEEIAVLLPGVRNEEDLLKVAEKLRTSISKSPYLVSKGENPLQIPITVSVGGGIYRGEDKDDFFNKVDKQALYQAKHTGRNKTVILP